MTATDVICKFNQSGFCKFRSYCRKQHVNEVCHDMTSSVPIPPAFSDIPKYAGTLVTLKDASLAIIVLIYTFQVQALVLTNMTSKYVILKIK